MLQVITSQPEDTQLLGAQLGRLLTPGMVVRLEGDLGSGKTTFTQGLGKALGVKRAIKSPTYTIIKEYELMNDLILVHIDAYRLEAGGQDTLDLDYYLNQENLVVIEWAQFIEESLPATYLTIHFQTNEMLTYRQITLTHNEQETGPYSRLLGQLAKEIGAASHAK